MLWEIWSGFEGLLGIEAEELSLRQMIVRALVVYLVGLALVRVGEKRFLGKSTAFDVLLAIILGSVLSRAINGTAPFIPTLAASLLLVGLHWLFSVLAFYSDRFGTAVKGRERVLIRDGEIRWDEMRGGHISRNDLLAALRTQARVTSPEEVEEARLERSGEISVMPRDGAPRVVEISVQEGVQTVRLEIGRGS
jgi:uncharacterized membrane protein YcaP (DUF421 family)